MKEEFDFESIKNKTIKQLKAGEPLLGKDGAFAPLKQKMFCRILTYNKLIFNMLYFL